MTETVQDTPQKTPTKRKSRAKDNSLLVMKELSGLMGQRTDILGKIRTKRLELAELESSLQQLGQEIQWRAGVFGMVQRPDGADIAQITQPMAFPGQPQQALTPPIFRQPEAPTNTSGINRGYADLSSLS